MACMQALPVAPPAGRMGVLERGGGPGGAGLLDSAVEMDRELEGTGEKRAGV